MVKSIINPYENVNFANTPAVPAISHEHIYNAGQFQNCYRRGIRIFACVNYFPSAPSVCPAGKLGHTTDSKFSGWRIPVDDWISPDVVPDDFFDRPLSELNQYKTTRYYEGSAPIITDANNVEISTDSLPQIANMEFAFVPWKRGDLSRKEGTHHNVLGNLFGVPTNGMRDSAIFEGMTWEQEKAWRANHPLYSMEELAERHLNPDYQQFNGKFFGTVNHNGELGRVQPYFDRYPNIFKAMELFNQGSSPALNRTFRNCYDTLLSRGYRIWGTAVVDWQGTREAWGWLTDAETQAWTDEYNSLTEEEKAQYGNSIKAYYDANVVRECEYDRGCNVLFIDNYDSLLSTPQQIAEIAIDAYNAGRYYMSGINTHTINNIVASTEKVTFSLNQSASKIVAKTRFKNIELSNTDTITVAINDSDVFIRFEAYFDDDKDFIFTNPIFIEKEERNLPLQYLQLDII